MGGGPPGSARERVSMDITEQEWTATVVREMEDALPPEDRNTRDREDRQEMEDELACSGSGPPPTTARRSRRGCRAVP
jgi:hypothetical protein